MSWQTLVNEMRPVWAQLVPVLMHSLWQAGLIAAVLWVALKMTPGGHARRRHAMSLWALVAVVLAMGGTWGVGWIERQGPIPGGSASLSRHPSATARGWAVGPEAGKLKTSSAVVVRGGSEFKIPEQRQMEWKDWVGPVWALGTALGLARCMVEMLSARRLMRTASPVTDPAWLAALARAREALGMKPGVVLAISDRVMVPTVVGFLRPMVLIPGFAAPGLKAEELALILAHELAHVRRQDLWIGLFQALLEAVLFFNPGLRWISRQVSVERECCCDLDATGISQAGPVPYVELLARWLSQEVNEAGRLSVAMGLDGRYEAKLPVLERISRVLFPGRRVARRIPVWALSAGLGAFVLLGAGAGLAAQAVVKAWTPEQRVKELVKAQPVNARTEEEATKDTQIMVEVETRAAPGQTLGPGGMMQLAGVRSSGAGWYTQTVDKPGTQSFQCSSMGVIWVALMDPSTGVSVAGPLVPGERSRFDKVKMELEAGRGSVRTVTVVREDGSVVAGAQVGVQVAWTADTKGNLMGGNKIWTTDGNGQAMFKVDSVLPVLVWVMVEGCLPGRARLEPKGPDEVRVVMKRGVPTTGRLVSAATGEPAAGVEVEVIAYRYKDSTPAPYSGWGGTLNTGRVSPPVKTDEKGMFTLRVLEKDWLYTLVARDVQGKPVALITEVMAGTDLGDVRVGTVRISGTLSDPDGLMKGDPVRLWLVTRYGTEKDPYRDGGVEIKPRKAKGGGWTFDTGEVCPALMEIKANSATVSGVIYEANLKPGEAIKDVVLDLGQLTPRTKAMSSVTFKLVVPEGEPVPVGVLGLYPVGSRFHDVTFTKEDQGEKTVMLPSGANVVWTSTTLFPGFKVENAANFKVQEDASTKVVTLKLEPAGAVVGRVEMMDGKAWPLFDVDSYEVNGKGVEKKRSSPIDSQAMQAKGKFTVDELEFGKTYVVKVTVVRATGEKTEHRLGPYLITKEQPVRNVELLVGKQGTTVVK